MRQLTANEILTMSKLLKSEVNGLAVAKASMAAISDEQLKTLVQSGIAGAQARIKGLQQFIDENNVTSMGEVQ